MFTIPTLAVELHVTEGELRKAFEDGRLPRPARAGRQYVITPEIVEAARLLFLGVSQAQPGELGPTGVPSPMV